MSFIEKSVLGTVLVALVGLSVWLQYSLLESERESQTEIVDNEPDYYIETFIATGLDEEGRRYIVEADRMVHYPQDDTALLDNPHIIQYPPDSAPRHIYANSGWMSSDGEEILLTGRVRVVQGRERSGNDGGDSNDKSNLTVGSITTTDKMKIRLRGKKS